MEKHSNNNDPTHYRTLTVSKPSLNVPPSNITYNIQMHISLNRKQLSTYLATCGTDANISIWNLGIDKKPLIFKGHTAEVYALQYSPTSLLLASSSKDETIRLWTHTADGKSRVIKGGHHGPIRALDFSFDSQLLVSGSDDKTIKLWDTDTLKFKGSIVGHKNWVRSVRFSPDASLIGSGGEEKLVCVWDADKRKLVSSFADHTGVVNQVQFHKHEPWIVSCSTDKTIKFHDLRTDKLAQHYEAHADVVNSISLHPQGNYMLSVSDDAETKIWDIRKGLLALSIYSHNGSTYACRFSKLGNYFATGGKDSKAVVWNTGLESNPNEAIKYLDLCATGHRADLRTIATTEEVGKCAERHSASRSKVSCSNPNHFAATKTGALGVGNLQIPNPGASSSALRNKQNTAGSLGKVGRTTMKETSL